MQKRYIIFTGLIISLIFYFVFHSIYGNRGIISFFRNTHLKSKYEKELVELKKEREDVEKRVKLLRPDSLDLDMLEEKAREVLGYSDPDEIIVNE